MTQWIPVTLSSLVFVPWCLYLCSYTQSGMHSHFSPCLVIFSLFHNSATPARQPWFGQVLAVHLSDHFYYSTTRKSFIDISPPLKTTQPCIYPVPNNAYCTKLAQINLVWTKQSLKDQDYKNSGLLKSWQLFQNLSEKKKNTKFF
jgi:hypothetical protein